MRNPDGKIALDTVSTGRIGSATAKFLATEVAPGNLTSRRQGEAVAKIFAHVIGVRADIESLSDLTCLFPRIKAGIGWLNIVFTDAGTAQMASVSQLHESYIHRVIDADEEGVLFNLQKVLPVMPDGSTSVRAVLASGGKRLPVNPVYAFVKAAISSFARTRTTDPKTRVVRVNAVSRGTIETPESSVLLGDSAQGKELMLGGGENVPPGRMSHTEKNAPAVSFLASDYRGYVTGAQMSIDGGVAQV